MWRLYLILGASSIPPGQAAKLRVLFVGNSFTYVNELPRQLQNIAESLGDELETNSSTVGGCTLYYQEASRDHTTAALLDEEWDYIVLQDYSLLPTVERARELYLNPTVEDFARRKKDAKVVMYLTWGYHDGLDSFCPTSATPQCFPLGTLEELTEPSCETSLQYQRSVRSFECMGYSLARGYFGALSAGADLVAPCGLAWQVARGSTTVPEDCKELVDAEYGAPFPLDLPLKVKGGALPNLLLNIRNLDGSINKHPDLNGCYLNALVFYATLFRRSPVGAARPIRSLRTWGQAPASLTERELLALQTAAEGTVEQCGVACGLAAGQLPRSLVTVFV